MKQRPRREMLNSQEPTLAEALGDQYLLLAEKLGDQYLMPYSVGIALHTVIIPMPWDN
jgi:hypothetical protein